MTAGRTGTGCRPTSLTARTTELLVADRARQVRGRLGPTPNSPVLTNVTAKKTRLEELAKRDANDRDISEYFTKGAGKTQSKPKVTLSTCLQSAWKQQLTNHSRSSRQKPTTISLPIFWAKSTQIFLPLPRGYQKSRGQASDGRPEHFRLPPNLLSRRRRSSTHGYRRHHLFQVTTMTIASFHPMTMSLLALPMFP